MKKIWRRIIGSIVVLVVLLIVLFYVRAVRPYYQAKSEATQMAQKYADLQETDHFYWFTRQKTYFSLLGKNANGTKIVVLIPEDGKKVTILKQADGVTAAQAKKTVAQRDPQRSFFKINLGMVDDQAVWEVVMKAQNGTLDYYLVDFKTGKITSKLSQV